MRGNKKGFTLIEMIVALGVFVILMTSIVGVFLVVQRSQRTSYVKERLLTSARHTLDSMVGDIRTGIPDYSNAQSPSTLYLKDEDGASIVYQRATIGCPAGSSVPTGASTACIMRQGVPLTPQGITVDGFTVTISPDTNPFPGGTKQPIVTILLTLSSNEGLPTPATITVQTSASSRVYGP